MARQVKAQPTPSLTTPITAKLLGEAIRARRTQSGLRLEDAAALCGVAKQTLMKIEHGAGTTSLENVLQICMTLGINLTIQPWEPNAEANDDWQ
ncbi:helix-turn-helix domain-containing protein [Oceanimonas baumannii]|uniref:helix-turn-helix domain-containing protein n=1 Tax=Oceanimonas baumannii TaxID=129578 RepID=UPI001D192E32|nr:helix-turn-helix transcriptional regulator [Oceanimonas baumannii]MCC4263476.1 helix-turn-helix domain-containing protein [Oceanimonas baumannii]